MLRKTENSLGSTTQETLFSYISGKTNTVGNINMGITFLGKQCVNPVSSATYSPTLITGPNPLNYTYEYDPDGRIIKATTNNNLVITYSYYYCDSRSLSSIHRSVFASISGMMAAQRSDRTVNISGDKFPD
jgi:YD repeat-containing protein